MTVRLFLPADELGGESTDFDRAADFLELAAFFAAEDRVAVSDLPRSAGIGADDGHRDLDEEMRDGEDEIVDGAVGRIKERGRALEDSYPFSLDSGGETLKCVMAEDRLDRAAYILGLVLSNLRAVSPILDGSGVHPGEQDVRELRRFFQYFATAALAAEICGHAWSFGFPRPDGSGFLTKLGQVWAAIRDGRVEAQTGAPDSPMDGGVDVFAARPHRDGLPGFPIAAAQVATGRNWRGKSLKGHLGAFKSRWFATQPVTEFVPYMIVPFARGDDMFIDDVRVMGNMLHRLRTPRRVAEAGRLVEAGMTVEGYDRLEEASRWLSDYRRRAGTAA